MDFPKHIECLNKGLTGQYYRLCGSNNYKCRSCGIITNSRVFEPVEYSWKEEPDKWRVWVSEKISKEAKKLVEDIVSSAKKSKEVRKNVAKN